MTRLKTSGLPAASCCSTALSRWNFSPLPSALPVIALMRSIQTAVGCLATVRIFAARVASLCFAAEASTEADQVGFTYWTAPAYGLSTRASAAVAVGRNAMDRGSAASATVVATPTARRRRVVARGPCRDTWSSEESNGTPARQCADVGRR